MLTMSEVRFVKTVDELKWEVPVVAEGINPKHKEMVLGKLQSKRNEVVNKSHIKSCNNFHYPKQGAKG